MTSGHFYSRWLATSSFTYFKVNYLKMLDCKRNPVSVCVGTLQVPSRPFRKLVHWVLWAEWLCTQSFSSWLSETLMLKWPFPPNQDICLPWKYILAWYQSVIPAVFSPHEQIIVHSNALLVGYRELIHLGHQTYIAFHTISITCNAAPLSYPLCLLLTFVLI